MNFAELSFYKNHLGLTNDDLLRFTDLKIPELIDFRQGLSVPLRIARFVLNGYRASVNDETGLIKHIEARNRNTSFYTDHVSVVYSRAEALWLHPTEGGEISRDTLALDNAFTFRFKDRLLNVLGLTLKLWHFNDKRYCAWLEQARVIDTLECRADYITEELQDQFGYDTSRIFLLF